MAEVSLLTLRLMAAVFAAAVAPALMADVTAVYDPSTEVVTICCLKTPATTASRREDLRIKLSHVSAPAGSSMLAEVSGSGQFVTVKPRFPLLPGEDYVATVSWGGPEQISIPLSVDAIDPAVPELVSISPSSQNIPANTLRIYLTFSEAMARGQVRDYIHIEDDQGDRVENPFLNLSAELWAPGQRRLTLLMDPGQIKRGVGPNESHGAPLFEGREYKLIVSGLLRSADGIELGESFSKQFSVADSERRPLTLQTFALSNPDSATGDPLTVVFDRAMDAGSLARSLLVSDASGEPVRGRITVSDHQWSFSPTTNWRPGTYTLRVASALEDVAGNSFAGAFDSEIDSTQRRDNEYKIRTVRFFVR